jgi:hypothetical protein
MNPILIAAAKFELDPLCNTLQQRGHTPETKLAGVGALNAAKKALRLGEACRGRDVIFVGTCGTFGVFTQRVTLVRAKEVVWIPTCERVRMSYTVKDSAPPVLLPEPPLWCKSLPERKVVCTPAVSLIGTVPEGGQAETMVENLELYSCIGEIAAQARSVAVVLAITNAVGADSHAQWRQHFAEAAGLTAEFIGARL